MLLQKDVVASGGATVLWKQVRVNISWGRKQLEQLLCSFFWQNKDGNAIFHHRQERRRRKSGSDGNETPAMAADAISCTARGIKDDIFSGFRWVDWRIFLPTLVDGMPRSNTKGKGDPQKWVGRRLMTGRMAVLTFFFGGVASYQRHFISRTPHVKDKLLMDASFHGHFISRTLPIMDTSYQGHFISMTLHIEDTSYQWHFISRTLHIKDASYQGHLTSRTLHIMETSFQGYFISRVLHIK